jgi:Uma2 family endonuclease
MSTTAATLRTPSSAPEPGFVSLTDFLVEYSNREDPFKYEWNGGVVEQKPHSFNRGQFFLLQNLQRRFIKTSGFSTGGLLTNGVDMFLPFSNRTRRPDIAYLSGEQMRASIDNKPTVCAFVIEIISQNDQVNDLEEKKAEYFDNGVQVLWIIFPNSKKVEVYRSVKDVTICLNKDVCNAAPVLPDFEITVQELFA